MIRHAKTQQITQKRDVPQIECSITPAEQVDASRQAERACEGHGGFFSELDQDRGYACLFGGEFPETGFGANYERICGRYDGTIFEEAPPLYGYTCSLNQTA